MSSDSSRTLLSHTDDLKGKGKRAAMIAKCEEEIEEPKPPRKVAKISSSASRTKFDSTADDEHSMPMQSNYSQFNDVSLLPPLPEFFQGLRLQIHSDLPTAIIRKVHRQVITNGGDLVPGSNVVIGLSAIAGKVVVNPDWIFESQKAQRLVSRDHYIIQSIHD